MSLKSILSLACCLALGASLVWPVSVVVGDDTAPRPSAGGVRGGKLRHVVLFKFKDSATPADVERIVATFRGLPAKITEIDGFEWGTDVSPEGKAQGFTHCFLVTFKSEADRDAYLPHPAHQEFVAIVRPHVDQVCVVDFWGAE